MRPVSDEFLRAIRGSHMMIVRARVCAAGQTGTDPEGTSILVLGGDVRLDASADIRSTLDLMTDGNDAWPDFDADLLAPYGNEIFIERGIEYGTGVREWVSLGYHRIETVEQDDAPNGPIRLACNDRMAGIIEARLLAPRQYLADAVLGDVVEELILEVYPSASIEWDDATDAELLGRAVILEEDRYGGLNDLVTAHGKIWYWDYRGVLVVKNVPDSADVVFEITHGEGGVLVEPGLARHLTREGIFNAVVAAGEAADTDLPVRAVAVDGNPASRTFWDGPFGKVPRFYSSPLLTTQAQAQAAAAAILSRSLGAPYSVDLSSVPNPALEPYDPVKISHGGTVGAEVHILDQISIPLTADGPLTASTREQTGVMIGEG